MVARSTKSFVPDRGDVVWIDFDPQAGHEQAGRRPALVLSPQIYNRPSGLALLCPITSHAKGYPYEVRIPEGLRVNGVIMTDQVKNMAWRERQAVYLCQIPEGVLDDVVEKLLTLIDPQAEE